MKTITTADFKANFSSVVDELKHGNKVIITYGREKEPLATQYVLIIGSRCLVSNPSWSDKY
jgi:hypothetical protein